MKIAILGHRGADAEALAERLGAWFPEDIFVARSFSGGEAAEALDADGVILAVSLMEGPMPGTRSALETARSSGMRMAGLALTRLDAFDAQSRVGPHIKELVGLEARELASIYGYGGDIPMARLALTPEGDAAAQAFYRAARRWADGQGARPK